jgi:hypothetical protein
MMRVALFLLFVFISLQKVFSQDNPPTKRPSQKEIQGQLKHARNEAQQQIIDSENEIAEAKKKNVDPEEIKEMEKNLATLKKMLGVLDKVNTSVDPRSKQLTKINYPVIKYISPIVPIRLAQKIPPPTKAQAKDNLLWYKGKKIDNNTLITTSGMIVRYDRRQSRIITQSDPKKDSGFINLVSKLSKTESLKNDFASRTKQIKNSFLMYPEIIKAYDEFDLIRKRFDELARNTIVLPSITGMTASTPFTGNQRMSGPFWEWQPEDILPIGFQQVYQELLQLMNNPAALDVVPPPKRPSNLCLCDQQARMNYENQLRQWMQACWAHEDELINKVEKLHRFLADNNSLDISQTPNIYSDLDRALKMATEQKDQKLERLISNYGSDVQREEAIALAIIATEREKQKMGSGEVSATFNHTGLFSSDNFERYIATAMEGKDYNVVFDYSLYLSHEYHKQLFGGQSNIDETAYFRWQGRLEAYNRFKLTIDLDFEHHYVVRDGDIMQKSSGVIKSTPLLVSLGRLGCKWQLFIHDTNYENDEEDKFRIPFKVASGTRQIKKEEIWVSYPYVGPKDMLMVFPSFRLSFCQNSGSDSALMEVLRYKNEIFNLPNVNVSAMGPENIDLTLDPKAHYTVDMLAYANLVFVAVEKAKANREQLVDLAGEMMDVQNNVHLEKATGNSILDRIQMEYSANRQQHQMQHKLTKLGNSEKSVVLFNAHNNSDLLIDEQVNMAHTELNNVSQLVRAKVNIKVVHSPSSGWNPRDKYL